MEPVWTEEPPERERSGGRSHARAAALIEVGRRLLDVALPPRCPACGARIDGNGMLCAACWGGITFLGRPCCACCGLPFPYEASDDALCPVCIAVPPAYDRARSAMLYDDRSRGLILAFKHGDRLHAAPALARFLMRAGAGILDDVELIVPVPLHWTRLFRRRYNQSAVLALALARHLRAAGKRDARVAPDLLTRHRRTPVQGRRSPAQRLDNVRGAFRVAPEAMIAGRRIVLIDDVLTSGATVNECARVLKRAGAAHVAVLTVARAVKVA